MIKDKSRLPNFTTILHDGSFIIFNLLNLSDILHQVKNMWLNYFVLNIWDLKYFRDFPGSPW